MRGWATSLSSNNFPELVVHVVDDFAITVAAILAKPRNDVLNVQSTLLEKLNRFSQRVVTLWRTFTVEMVK